MEKVEFDQLVAAGIDAIPEPFASKLNNVVITVADQPTPEQLKIGRVPPGNLLLGLYEGIPQNRRGSNYSLVLPDKITIFKLPIMTVSGGNPERIKQLVTETVWHEVAHHFGLDEREVRAREAKRH